MTIRKQIKEIIKKAVSSYAEATEDKNFTVEIPENKEYGDYATNVALILAKKEKRGPMEVANEIRSKIDDGIFEKIDIVNGFINFYFKPEFLQNQIKEIIKENKNYGKTDIGKGKKVQVEFISSNPTGPLTVANGRGGPMGDVLANILNFVGYKIKKEFYVNNAGNQIAVLGHSILKDDQAQYKGEYIDLLADRIKEKDAYEVGQKAAEIIIDEMIKKTIDKFGIKYDEWFWESNLHKKDLSEKIIKLLKDKNLLYEQDGATWFKSSSLGDNRDRVLIKKDGLKTYLASDIAYHYNKFKERKFDKVINIWGADHHGDVPGLMAGVEAIGYKGQLEIILQQFITVIEKGKKIKMSKRLGTFIPMDDLLDAVGSDVVRFFFLMHSNDKQMDFDLDLAKEKSDKNPVYYVQYAYARINSILRKTSGHNLNVKLELLNHSAEIELIKNLIAFPEIIEEIAKDYQVHRLPAYAMKVASLFHRFYTECHVLGEKKDLEKARLALIMATKIVLENILNLMGISKPEKM
ncbi:arginine--tRNA ligase [Patescibacteria group bacterium]|nr:arginine--tRNA ligase [Patescibacteria group bacterium]MBU4458686.1 arginine--tRNA ligase [Patescibacteria group bacterium]MCG2696281.1 arginine--tRNA ligase [Candidatus Portnoybacteria bacterium]